MILGAWKRLALDTTSPLALLLASGLVVVY
jgi:hypothetical protein